MVRCGEGELGYHIFYQMIEGSDDSLRRELQLGSRATENNDFLPPLTEVTLELAPQTSLPHLSTSQTSLHLVKLYV